MKLSELVDLMCAASSAEEAMDMAVAFTHVDDETKLSQTFATGVMRRSAEIQALEVVEIKVDAEFARFMARNRGVEAHRLGPLLDIHPSRYPPILVAAIPPLEGKPSKPPSDLASSDVGHTREKETHLVIDGTHRFVAAAMQEAPTILARIVPEIIWRKYIIEGIPAMTEEEVLAMPSGMAAGGGITPEAMALALNAMAKEDDEAMQGLVSLINELKKKFDRLNELPAGKQEGDQDLFGLYYNDPEENT